MDQAPVEVSLVVPPNLSRLWSSPPDDLVERIYLPSKESMVGDSLGAALALLRSSAMYAPVDLIPVTYVDERSIACLSLADNEAFGWRAGNVVRWHLDDIEVRYQGAILDIDLEQFVASLVEEQGPAWDVGYKGVIELANSYYEAFVQQEIIPKPHDLRPFQLACQNVIIGLAAFQRDFRIDGLSVPFWQTCDVPHVATGEGNRALTALMLCDAFQSGGTMEISFARHPEGNVPASLRRFGRTVGVELGREMPNESSISPSEARALFWAVTPMPLDLRRRSQLLIDTGVCSVERLCYSLLSPVWGAEALDFLLACSEGSRVASILEGGADVLDRPKRGAEMELMRAALMLEMFVSRLDSKDSASNVDSDGQVRLFEDTTYGVTWSVRGDIAAVEIGGFPSGELPWQAGAQSVGRILVLPRPHPVAEDFELARRLIENDSETPVAILTSVGIAGVDDLGINILRCPTRIPELDMQIERNLVASSLGRS